MIYQHVSANNTDSIEMTFNAMTLSLSPVITSSTKKRTDCYIIIFWSTRERTRKTGKEKAKERGEGRQITDNEETTGHPFSSFPM